MRMVESGGAGGIECFPVGWNAAAKLCDSCTTAVAMLFCRKDSVFLCISCDLKMHHHHHDDGRQIRHERVCMCEVCEQAPASVTCKADAAALCVTCDRDIHSANPLSRRHDRIPVVPIYDSAEILVKSSASSNFLDNGNGNGNEDLNSSVTMEDEINWGFPANTMNIDVKYPCNASNHHPVEIKSSIEMLFPESDNHLLDFDFPVTTTDVIRVHNDFHDSVNDSVVPFQTPPPEKHFPPAQQISDQRSSEKRYEIDFTRSNFNSYNKNTYLSQSISHSVSSSSIDAGIVPEGNSISEISHPSILGVVELNGSSQQPTQLSGVDREARVMRYREKRKNRKFEKTIRYASRKAYAETRPRIKGRFAKRTESSTESEVDRWLFTAGVNSSKSSYGVEVEYGVVPSYCLEL